MIDYHKIWQSINNESKNNPLQPQIARKIPSNGLFNVFLATDFTKEIRLLYIKVDNDHDIPIENLPRFRGLDISNIVCSLGEFNDTKFIRFTQSIPHSENIFELVISDLCDKIINLSHQNKLNEILVKTLNEWKIFFEKQANEILSIGKQKGLFGELHFLRDYLFKKFSFAQSLMFWTGSDGTTHDFQILGNAVEVKTTSSKQHKKFIISSERQLDCKGLDHLYLSLYCLNLHSNMPERTLPALIREVSSQIKADSIASYQFLIKLTKYGYNASFADQYTIGFLVLEMKFYEIVDGFPRLLQRDLPNGVGDLHYSVMVSACTPFEININNVIQLI